MVFINKNYIRLECIDRVNYLTKKLQGVKDLQRRKNIVKDISRLENTILKIDYDFGNYGMYSRNIKF